MSKEYIKNILSKTNTCDAWALQVVKITNSKKNGTTYVCSEVTISPEGRLKQLVNEITDKYLSSELDKYIECRDYDGSADGQIIYKFRKDNILISENYNKLITALADPDSETDPLLIKTNASILKGTIEIDGEELSIKFISMQNPITSLKRKFIKLNGTFKEITDKVVSLRNHIDVLVLGDQIYMFNLSGEKLFNLERAHKSICSSKLEKIKNANIVTNFEYFNEIASTGHNPRKFISFNDEYLEKLSNPDNIIEVSNKFDIPINGDTKFDTNVEGTSEKIVKVLCRRGMIAPFDNTPMEVSGSKVWS